MKVEHPTHELREALLTGLPTKLLQASNLYDVLKELARHVMLTLAWEDCVIYLRDENELVQVAAWGPKSPDGVLVLEPVRLQLGQGIVGAAAANRDVLIVDDTAGDPRYVPDIGGGRSEMAVPIFFRDEVIGIIDSEHPEPNFYTVADAQAVADIAAIAAGQIEAYRTIDELRRARRHLNKLNRTDPLTRVGNRRQFESRYTEMVESGREFALASVDIDRFKEINDRYGHQYGDRVLSHIADVLVDHIDPHLMSVMRIGGDEFAMCGEVDDIRVLQDQLADAVTAIARRTADHVGLPRYAAVTVSVGLASGADDTVWRRSDEAMYAAKRRGGSRVVAYEAGDAHISARRLVRDRAERLDRLIADGELRLALQSVARPADPATPVFHEVLLRHEPTQGPAIPTGELLEAVLLAGNEAVVDRWVTERALRLLEADDSLAISVNWFPVTAQVGEMPTWLTGQIRRRNIDPNRLIIEVTEHTAIDDRHAFARTVRELRGAGVKVAIDDLGAGWSSLRTLADCSVDFVKLEGGWVRGMLDDPVAAAAVRSMIECGHLIDAQVIAESVESAEIMHAVADLGVDLVQGWHIHRPEITELS